MSLAHDDAILDATLEAADAVLATLYATQVCSTGLAFGIVPFRSGHVHRDAVARREHGGLGHAWSDLEGVQQRIKALIVQAQALARRKRGLGTRGLD